MLSSVARYLCRHSFTSAENEASESCAPKAAEAGGATQRSIEMAVLRADSDVSTLTFAARAPATHASRLVSFRDTFGSQQATPSAPPWPLAPSRVGSSVGSCSPGVPEMSPSPTPPVDVRLPEDHHPLPEHLALALAFVATNGGAVWCPTAGLFLARFAAIQPGEAGDFNCAGILTATAVLVASKLIDGPRQSISRFAPTFRLILDRIGCPGNPRWARRDMVRAEQTFLTAIDFSIAARPASLGRYSEAIDDARRLLPAGHLHDPRLSVSLARWEAGI